MTAAENDADDTLSEDEIVELLRDTLLDASVRFDRLEEELSGTDTDVFDALVALATTDDHVLLAPETRYRKFTTLCSTAADRGHDVSTEDVLRASIDEYDRTETLSEDIRSLSTLSLRRSRCS